MKIDEQETAFAGSQSRPLEEEHEESGSGWVEDTWNIPDYIQNYSPPSPSNFFPSRPWTSFLTFGRRIFSTDKSMNHPLFSQALFGDDSHHPAANSSILVPLLDARNLANTPDVIKRTCSRQSNPQETISEIPFTTSPSTSSFNSLIQTLKGWRPSFSQQSDLGLGLDGGIVEAEEEENVVPTSHIRAGFGIFAPCSSFSSASASSLGGPGSSRGVLWRQKAMEVLPVLGVVAMAVLCTVCYFVIAEKVGSRSRHRQFSLSCQVAEGNWLPSSDRQLYSPNCPYLRNTWKCRGGGSRAVDSWRWEPLGCSFPRFSPKEFLVRFQGKRIAFVGDESGANAFDSFVCMLAEAETPQFMFPEGSTASELDPSNTTTSLAPSSSSLSRSGGGSTWSDWWARHHLSSSSSSSSSRPESHLSDAASQALLLSSSHVSYRFPLHNVSLSFFSSPFLVKSSADVPQVNATACQLSRAAGAAANSSNASVPPSSRASSPCYPNRVYLDEVDPTWSTAARHHDVLVLNSGRNWREEVEELEGYALFRGGVEAADASLEGLREGARGGAQWGFPEAMQTVAQWLAEGGNFQGKAVFRSYVSGHTRQECASGKVLKDEFLGAASEKDFIRYNDAVVKAIDQTHINFLNVSLMSLERADGHPWMYSSAGSQPDCSNWCLPGVPDTWNEILVAMLFLQD